MTRAAVRSGCGFGRGRAVNRQRPSWTMPILCVLLVLACVGCLPEPSPPGPGPLPTPVSIVPARDGQGRVFLYLAAPERASDDLMFSLSDVAFRDVQGVWHESVLRASADAGALYGAQQLLGAVGLPRGTYDRVRLVFDAAGVQRGEKVFSLALPEERATSMELDLDVEEGDSQALFLDWDVGRSLAQDVCFAPRFALRPQVQAMRSLSLYVSSPDTGTLTMINRQTDEVVGVLGAGRAPMGLAMAEDGNRLYVADFGASAIQVVDTALDRVVRTIPNFGHAPVALALSLSDVGGGSARTLYAACPATDTVTLVDVTAGTVVRAVRVGRDPVDLVSDAARGRVYVACRGDDAVAVLDADTGDLLSTVSVGIRPVALALRDDRLFVASAGTANITVVDCATLRAGGPIALSGPSGALAAGGIPGWMHATQARPGRLVFVRTPMDMAVHTLAVGERPGRLAVDADRRKAYVADAGTRSIVVVDLTARRVVRNIPTAGVPHGLALVEE